MPVANVAINARRGNKDGFELNIEFDGDATYPAGGTPSFTGVVKAAIKAAAAAATDKQVRGEENITIVDVVAGDCGQYVPQFVVASDKLFVRDGGHATWNEVAPGDLSATKFNLTVLAK